MGRVVRTSTCEGDLLKIWRYLVKERKNLAAAERLLSRLNELFERLSDHPEIGTRQDRYRPSLRAFPGEAYVVFYEPIAGGIRVFRVLHGSRRLRPLLQPLRHALPEPAIRPCIIGLLGGVASGKSFVAEELQKLGAARLDADRVGHEVLLLPEVIAQLKARWGEKVIKPDGSVSRSAVAAIVFARTPEGREELKFLESITHPLIGVRLREEAQRLAAAGKRYLVLDAPVMLKAGWDSLCDVILYVDAPHEVRMQRALARGWTKVEFAAREAAQESLETKRRRADRIVENGGKTAETAERLAQWWQEFTSVIE